MRETDTVRDHPEKSENFTVALDGREYRLHRECGEWVWLAAMDAGIAGPYFWVRVSTLCLTNDVQAPLCNADRDPRDARAARIKAAQTRLDDVVKELGFMSNEYDAALHELLEAMREGRVG